MIILWIYWTLAVAVYCVLQAVRDFRRGDRAMAAAGAAFAICATLLMLMPIKTHAVKVDLILAPCNR
ncbi:hypothetical protein MGWOODY_Smn2568 [hydrothermal vent metagenome]|uniref:Uncharacterized protein n=1 Tax=hydrothermal vent metagenome TaxID=652676 RepID=A0A160THR4_9ZZZZ